MKKSYVLLIILTVVSLVGTILVYEKLPQEMPIHWNVAGEVDQWADKPMVFLLASMPIILIVLAQLLPLIDPKKKNYKLHGPAFTKTIIAIGLFFVALHWFSIAFVLGMISDIPMMVIMSLGVLFVVMGNFLPQAKHNYTFGIRLPWTLASEEVWRRTHRIGGALFVLAGLLLIAAAFTPKMVRVVMAIFAIVAPVSVTVVYSYIVYGRLGNGENEETAS